MITVQVISHATGNLVTDTEVGISIGNDGVKYATTDSRGDAHFDYPPQHNSVVYVFHKEVHKGRLEGRTLVYV